MKAIGQHPRLRRFYWRFEKALRPVLPRPEARVLGAISGGQDSVALAALLAEARDAGVCPIVFAHIHHGLRERADGDASFVGELATRLRAELTVVRLDLGPALEREGYSLEQAARAGRHEALAREAQRLGCDAVAMAHHMDDQAETVLVRILRGVGPGGLGAMAPAAPMPHGPAGEDGPGGPGREGGPAPRGLRLLRPLLDFRREEIASFLAELGLPHREDESNHRPDHLRNRVRAELLPHLVGEYNPRLVEGLADLARWARLESEPMHAWARTVLEEVLLTRGAGGGRLVIDAAGLRTHPDAVVTRVLWMAYQRLRGPEAVLGSRHVEDLLALLAKLDARGECDRAACAACAGSRDLGEAHLPGSLRARLAGGKLYLEGHDPRPDRADASQT